MAVGCMESSFALSIEEGPDGSRKNRVVQKDSHPGGRVLSVFAVETVEWIGPAITALSFQVDTIIVAGNVQRA